MPTSTGHFPEFRVDFQSVSKRFARRWILKDFTYTFRSGTTYGIKGRNGSGKSTLLRLLCGQLTPSRGAISYHRDESPLKVDEAYRMVSWSGPYLELVEELPIEEFFQFHFNIKPPLPGIKIGEIPQLIELEPYRRRKIMDCSSGMRQRVLLASALYANTPVLMLDEPTVTLDREAVEWFHEQLNRYGSGRLVVIASNEDDDLRSCDEIITMKSAN
ncbi:ATP-binding cassette domain-containing protein [Lewinella sp. W8]|uniref:ABC transporter ATP-binding protein n=1 Tax=Lewinella sp. W8 TaxID=2528208 RepID=UPI001565E552|nr:ATP-binding cassette domain-containing protein [Lewinella sp. W8]